MPRVFRRIIFTLFVLLFFISATILLFYASGYRYHAGKRAIEKTGKLIVETQPRGAQIRIDGAVVQPIQTPTSISYLLSGEYELTIEKDGYFPVRKRISIAPGVSTVVNDVVLIKKDAPRFLIPLEGVKEVVPRADVLFFHDDLRVFAFEVYPERMHERVTASEPISAIRISQSGAFIAIKTKHGWSIYNQEEEIFSEKERPFLLDVRFARASDDIYARTAQGIVRFDTATRVFVPVIKRQHIASFFVSDFSLFLLRDLPAPAGGPVLEEIWIPGGGLERTIGGLPAVSDILNNSNQTLVLQGPSQSVYLFDTGAQQAAFQFVNDARSAVFINRERFFSFNDFEIWEHQFSQERYTRSLVTRQSSRIATILPFKTRQLLLTVAQNGELHLRHLDARESAELLLATFDSVVDIALNQKEETLTIIGSFKGKQGIYTMALIEEEEVFPLVK